MLDLAQYRVKPATAREIAAITEVAIREGRLEAGETLPTMRALAATLKTSPATINSAYRILRERGLVTADGRRGTRVAPRPALRTAPRAPGGQPQHGRDLTIGLPDPALLPPIGPALQRVDVERKLRFDALDAPDPDLIQIASEALSADGLDARALTVVAGAFDGLERALQAHLRPGDRVLV
ncbi:MAG: GntR family transcriptional regulator, partial [Solirubrobacterales bacterium]|nr:GntR family transcriptional regulator [Solirubrobacterales bacterium]